MTVVNWVRLAGIGILAVVLQVSVLNGIVIAGAHPDLFVLLAAAAGILAGADRGAMIALYFGLVADLIVITPYGLSALTFVLVAYAVGLLQTLPPEAVPRSTQLLLVAAAGIAGSLVLAILGTLIGQTNMLTPELVAVAGIVAAGNLVMGVPAIALLRWALAGSQRVRADVAVAGGTSAR